MIKGHIMKPDIKMKTGNQKSWQFVSFLVCFILMGVVAVNRNDKLFGIHFNKSGESEIVDPIIENPDGTIIINTTPLTKDIIGYNGPTPVQITLRDGKITRITALKNIETPEYYGAVINSNLFDTWYGKTLEESVKIHPDGVAGASYTSAAYIRNIEAGINYALDNPISKNENTQMKFDFKFFCVIFIILAAAIVPLFFKDKRYRLFQLILNVTLLGLWGGTFISYSRMVSLMANGITTWYLIPVLLMLVTAFIYPFFGKKDYYCTWICPYGSIQELAGKCLKFKIRMSPNLVKGLNTFREALWFVLMVLMWSGLCFDWMDWEPFAAFYFNEISPVVLGIAGGFLLLSFFIHRPYCRFVCPTGSFFKLSEDNKKRWIQ